VVVTDNAYKNAPKTVILEAKNGQSTLTLDLKKSHGWYDVSVRVEGVDGFEQRFAGHVETGKDSVSDPAMA